MSILGHALRAGILFLALNHGAAAEPIRSMTLEPIDHHDALLTVVGATGVSQYAPADLEAMGTYRLTTTTPWRDLPADFDGVLLRDLLAAHGLDQVAALRIVAENDFAVTLPRAVWDSVPILVATRVNGKAHTRRTRGPIQLVMPMSVYESRPDMREGYWVWMAARIEDAS